MLPTLRSVRSAIVRDPDDAWATDRGWQPLYSAHPEAKIVVVGQAPAGGPRRPESRGTTRAVSRYGGGWGFQQKRSTTRAPWPCYPWTSTIPARASTGDLPPRSGFAARWHPLLLEHMPNVQITVLVGQYA